MSKRTWLTGWGLILALFLGFWSYGLFDLDEGIYAAALSEMDAKGDWLVPTLNDKPFFEKPILMYWLALPLVKLRLPGEIALRLPSVLASLGTVWLTGWFARRRFGQEAAFWTVITLGTSALFLGVGRMFMPDAPFVFFLTAALVTLFESANGVRGLAVVSGGALGAAVLAKGPVAAVVFLIIAVYAAARLPKLREGLRRRWLIGLLAFLAVTAAWYVPVAVTRGQEFFSEFVLRQNLGRVAGGDTAHLGPWFYYVPVVLLGFAPFSLLLAGAWRKCRASPEEAYLWVWVLAVFVIFSVAGSKLPHYALPAFPPLAILLAKRLVAEPMRFRFVGAVYGAVAAAVLLLAALWQPRFADTLLLMAIGAAMGAAAALWSAWRRAGFGYESAAASVGLAASALLLGAPAYWQESHGAVRTIAESARERGLPVVGYRMGALGAPGATAHPSINWYAGRRVLNVDWPDRLLSIALPFSVLSRRGRLDDGTQLLLESAGYSVKAAGSAGEYRLFIVSR